MTRTPDTIKAYLVRGRRLWVKAAAYHGLPPEILHPNQYVEWLDIHLPTLAVSSRRLYLASARQWLYSLHVAYAEKPFGKTAQHAFESLSKKCASDYATQQGSCKARRGRTSAQKSKRLWSHDLEQLELAASTSRSRWAAPAMKWLHASILLGLRPCEWRTAQFGTMNGKPFLRVQNAKNTNGRSHGKYRHLDLSELGREELGTIMGQLQSVAPFVGSDQEWKKFYSGLRHTILVLTRKCLGNRRKYPTLYSARHQFAADAKASGLEKVEIAAMMGHASDDTATLHYGKRVHGRNRCRITPVKTEIQKVRIRRPKRVLTP